MFGEIDWDAIGVLVSQGSHLLLGAVVEKGCLLVQFRVDLWSSLVLLFLLGHDN